MGRRAKRSENGQRDARSKLAEHRLSVLEPALRVTLQSQLRVLGRSGRFPCGPDHYPLNLQIFTFCKGPGGLPPGFYLMLSSKFDE